MFEILNSLEIDVTKRIGREHSSPKVGFVRPCLVCKKKSFWVL
jgi:hypothetical protein